MKNPFKEIMLCPDMWVLHSEFPNNIFEIVGYDFEYSFYELRTVSKTGAYSNVESPADLIIPFWLQPFDILALNGVNSYKISKVFPVFNKKTGYSFKVTDEYANHGVVTLTELEKMDFKNF